MLLVSCNVSFLVNSVQCVLLMNLSDLFCMICSFFWCVFAASCIMFGAYVMRGLMSALYR